MSSKFQSKRSIKTPILKFLVLRISWEKLGTKQPFLWNPIGLTLGACPRPIWILRHWQDFCRVIHRNLCSLLFFSASEAVPWLPKLFTFLLGRPRTCFSLQKVQPHITPYCFYCFPSCVIFKYRVSQKLFFSYI